MNILYKYVIILIYYIKGRDGMKYKQFDVVVLKNENRATILSIIDTQYNVEIVNKKGKRIEMKLITDEEIDRLLFRK